MKVSKFKLAFIILVTATIIWAIAFYYTLQEYHERISQEPLSEWELRKPYWLWNGGLYVCVAGGFLFVAWICFIVVAIDKFLERKKPTLNVLEASSHPSP